jgi:hypothetical protein
MKLAFGNSVIAEDSLLLPPDLPQAATGVLDLSSPEVLNDGAVKVKIPSYPQQGWGDRVTVHFNPQSGNLSGIRRFCYLRCPGEGLIDLSYVAEARIQPLTALSSGIYEVDYIVTSRTGNASNSMPKTVEVINAPEVPSGLTAVIDTAFFGTYRNNIIGSWVVPEKYQIAPGSDIAVRSLKMFAPPHSATAGVQLGIYWTPVDEDEQLFAYLRSDDGDQWTPVPVQQQVTLSRGDLVSIKLEGNQNARLFVALTM